MVLMLEQVAPNSETKPIFQRKQVLMIKSLVIIPWLLVFIGAQVGAAPTIIQPPLQDQGATTLAVHQSDDINVDGQVNVTLTEAPLFGFILSPITREHFERLQQFASELEGDAILDAQGPREHHSAVFGLHSIMAKIADGVDATREILHSVSIKASSLWRLTPFTHQITKFTPEVFESGREGDGFEEAFQEDIHYSVDDLSENQFDNTVDIQLFEQLISGLIRSHIHSEQSEEVAGVEAVEDGTQS